MIQVHVLRILITSKCKEGTMSNPLVVVKCMSKLRTNSSQSGVQYFKIDTEFWRLLSNTDRI